jgi:hypothetical protein
MTSNMETQFSFKHQNPKEGDGPAKHAMYAAKAKEAADVWDKVQESMKCSTYIIHECNNLLENIRTNVEDRAY